MADEQNDNKVISKNNSGFPAYLDFDNLRSEGIEYLGKLSGKIWTDHNVHDPGITILETLCYALLDLGYRTNLPVKDIFSRNPDDKLKDDNFLTPSQILTCNPLTITDFRKLLIDIEGVKNAWLEIAIEDHDKPCPPRPKTVPSKTDAVTRIENMGEEQEQECCIDYLNGLYHVYIALEDGKQEDLKDEKKKMIFLKEVKAALLLHRNLCEDFVDIKFLCKWEIGVCADIELEADIDPETVYLEMAAKLRDFFSPSPKFYTLPQLLEKKKTIDEIFAGRPYNIKESHGFVDTEELESLKLRKTIHVSDVYNVLFSVKGIRRVKRLRLRNCTDHTNREDAWAMKIPKDHIPDFSVACSGFQFTRQGMPISFDFKKYEVLLDIGFQNNGKALYKFPSDKLDTEIPKGIYRKDLGAYYSVQNEFPRVYGIAEGGLPSNASPLRMAQALQLKGYLLFFDQLLANYLVQLKNIRSLFSLSLSDQKTGRQTYFVSKPDTVPDLQQLVRYKIGDDNTDRNGSSLARPVSREWLKTKIENKELHLISLEAIESYPFSSGLERDIAVRQLQEDAFGEQFHAFFVTKKDDCVFYYVFTSSSDYALISNRYYKDEQEARAEFGALKYAAATGSNYYSYNLDGERSFSFRIETGVSTYTGYLQLLAQDETLNYQRRQSFLEHLLSRFAERFTDFALISFGYYDDAALKKRDTRAKEFYLHNYPALSSNRGKAFDYSTNQWNSGNISGLEKRFKALIGSEDLKRQSLCNFEVYEYSKKFFFTINLAGKISFSSDEKFESVQEAKLAAKKMFEALENRSNYHIEETPYKKEHPVYISYDGKKQAMFTGGYSSKEMAAETADRLHKIFSANEINGKEEIASYLYLPSLINDYNGQVVRVYSEAQANETAAGVIAVKKINKINDTAIWELPENVKEPIGKLIYDQALAETPGFIDVDRFVVDVHKNTPGKPGLLTYEVLDEKHRFAFKSLGEFKNDKDARTDSQHLLCVMIKPENYRVGQDEKTGKPAIVISEGEKMVAISLFELESEAIGMKKEIQKIVSGYTYHLQIDPVPDKWEFVYNLGYEAGRTYTLRSQQTYPGKTEATRALIAFDKGINTALSEKSQRELVIKSGKENNRPIIARVENMAEAKEDELNKSLALIGKELELQKEIRRLHTDRDKEKTFEVYVATDKESECSFVYQLVDKDAVLAVYTGHTGTEITQTRKKAIKKDTTDYNFPELCLRGDVTVERTGQDGKTKRYHYQVKTLNTINKPGGGTAEKLVLFESISAYVSKEEAEKAFAGHWLPVLKLGLLEENYGEKKAISLNEIRTQPDDSCIKSASIVFVPAETKAYLGVYTGGPLKNLLDVVKSYPVRSIHPKDDCKEFHERFLPCAEEDCDKTKEECSTEKEKLVYFFVLYDKETGEEHWQSIQYYETPEAATSAFRFFLLLLCYEGNYYLGCDCKGIQRIYIREVLAESTDRFIDHESAWGADGIQKFIGVTQTPEPFYPYVDENCYNHFFVACKNISAFHPCKYDSPAIRDKVQEQLERAAGETADWTFANFCGKWDERMLDFNGQSIASIRFKGDAIIDPQTGYLANYINIVGHIHNHCLCIDDDKQEVYLDIDEEHSIYFTLIGNPNIDTLEKLKKELLWIACYFPFIKKESSTTSKNRNGLNYSIEIRLPGFNSCEGKETGNTERCSVAWVTECYYDNCASVIAAFKTIFGWIRNEELYQKVFDCMCGSYGISLHDKTTECVGPGRSAGHEQVGPLNNQPQISRIIAMSPQCYSSAEMVCDGIERAKRLINSEGLQLVEHILLRPHCKEDCGCTDIICKPGKWSNCDFEWKDFDDEDPCNKDKEPVCFVPGYDPYSFIATIALPAWPERFRKKENRELIENILYREAPAHVALRILWLTPHDLCCFETKFREWLRWSALQPSCDKQYTNCDFITFLFKHEFECLADFQPCDTCSTGTIPQPTCIEQIKDEVKQQQNNNGCPQSWLEQLTELYCWKECDCEKRDFIDCKDIKHKASSQSENTTPLPNIDHSSKAKFVNGRFASYSKHIDEIAALAKKSKYPQLVDKARSFLKMGRASVKEYQQLVTDLLKAMNTVKDARSPFGKKQLHDVIINLTCFFLDKSCFNGQHRADLDQCAETFSAMRESGIKPVSILRAWNPESVKKYEPKLDLHEIEKLFTG